MKNLSKNGNLPHTYKDEHKTYLKPAPKSSLFGGFFFQQCPFKIVIAEIERASTPAIPLCADGPEWVVNPPTNPWVDQTSVEKTQLHRVHFVWKKMDPSEIDVLDGRFTDNQWFLLKFVGAKQMLLAMPPDRRIAIPGSAPSPCPERP